MRLFAPLFTKRQIGAHLSKKGGNVHGEGR
ncbi:hypothetical protein SAMN04488542_11586 [Fontibacillus panacisegetis]|uniref:Uncharacterized protein n=1 Tax=Fontibacillus panacisegetis TaxID=670482 RepID=A0A1G7NAH6_9BACL|nr:hypothetical protein SAMN04488542_11586 [Fontibacillus panacisegetis]